MREWIKLVVLRVLCSVYDFACLIASAAEIAAKYQPGSHQEDHEDQDRHSHTVDAVYSSLDASRRVVIVVDYT